MNEDERIAIGRKACISAGVNIIQSFTQGIAEAELLREMYEPVVEAELTLHKWRFATKADDISANLLADEPDNSKWNCAYQQPSDVLSVDTVLVDGVPIGYDREGSLILTKDTANDTVVLKYRHRADERDWAPYFKLLIIYRLATLLAWSIARKTDIAELMKVSADEHWRRAKTEDSQAQTNQRLRNTALKRARGGRVDRFWRDR